MNTLNGWHGEHLGEVPEVEKLSIRKGKKSNRTMVKVDVSLIMLFYSTYNNKPVCSGAVCPRRFSCGKTLNICDHELVIQN